jgi:hypothetical protein
MSSIVGYQGPENIVAESVGFLCAVAAAFRRFQSRPPDSSKKVWRSGTRFLSEKLIETLKSKPCFKQPIGPHDEDWW